MSDLKIGIYQHYKGKKYEVIDIARNSETLEKMVVYKALYAGEFPEGSLWVRPLKMFSETVVRDGKNIPRFRYIGLAILFVLLSAGQAGIAAEATASRDTRTWAPKSTLKSSEDVRYLDPQNAQAVTHTNVSVDDTTDDAAAEVQQKTEWKTSNTVTVLNNMGPSGKIYTAEDLDSKTGQPTEKKGVVEIPKGKSARFNTAGTVILEPEKDNRRRVLIS